MRHGIVNNLTVLKDRPGLGYRFDGKGEATVDGTLYRLLDVTAPDGRVEHVYLNAETGRKERSRMEKALHPDVDATVQRLEDRVTGFGDCGGARIPFYVVTHDLDTGARTQETEILACALDAALDPAAFRRPD